MHSTIPAALLLLAQIASSSPISTSLKWGPCLPKGNPAGLSCATLLVPIDWTQPHGEQTPILMAKQAAKDQKDKIGSLIFNPGGPGVSASELVISIAEFNVTLFPAQFDIIAPDPRGVGFSHPLSCDPELFNERVSWQPTDEASFQQLVAHNKALGESCRKRTGPLLGHMDTYSVARDFDAIRTALGEDRITYLGISYGTVIGPAYAEQFPANIRAMALDGNVDHSLSQTITLADEVASYENVFTRFASWCENTSSCPLHKENVTQLFENPVAQADKKPIPAPACKGACRPDVTGEEIRFNFQDTLFFKTPPSALGLPNWSDAAAALKQAAAGNATALSTATAKYPNDTAITTSGIATLCLDWNHTATSLTDLVCKEQMTTDLAPITKGASPQFQLQSACIGWPEPVQHVPCLTNVTGTPPILLTNAFHDPSTPYMEANGVLGQLQTAVLATRNGDGHTSYFLLGETYEAINKYLCYCQNATTEYCVQQLELQRMLRCQGRKACISLS